MSDDFSLRVVIVLFLTAAVALAVYQGGNNILASVGVIVAGLGASLILSFATNSPPASSAPIDANPTENEINKYAMINAISEPVLLLNDNRVRMANEAALKLLGRHIVGEDIRVAIRHPAATSRFAVDADDGRTELSGFGGTDRNLDLNVTTIAPGQRLVHLVDRGAQQVVERARTDFVANASHELRTPLAAILGFVETLADDNAGSDPDVRHRFLDIMMKEARRMQRLIDDLISLSRIESEKYDLPDEIVSLSNLVRQVVAELPTEKKRFSISIDGHDDQINGDAPQLSQLIHNLVGNAVKYGRADRDVRVIVRTDTPNVILSVADEGEGIPAEHLPRLTERFYRVDSGRSQAAGGTGLGLAIVKHIVERHRGRLDINSKVGVGTTVTVTFPAASLVTVTLPSPN